MLRLVIRHHKREFKTYCYDAMLRRAGMAQPLAPAPGSGSRMFLSTTRLGRNYLSRADETATKPNNYNQAKDILKSIEEKEAIEKKKATDAASEAASEASKTSKAATSSGATSATATSTLAAKKILWQKVKVEATSATATSTLAAKKTLWQKVKAEAIHYWHGTKLLGLEVRISSRLIWKLLKGAKLSRRENRQVRNC
jgi:hypothetical protein